MRDFSRRLSHFKRLASAGKRIQDFFAAGLAGDIELLDLTPEIAVASNELPRDFPGDLFDRTIVATARVLNLKLISPDPVIRDARFCRVEYYPFRPSRANP